MASSITKALVITGPIKRQAMIELELAVKGWATPLRLGGEGVIFDYIRKQWSR